MIPDVTPNGVFYLPPTGWLTSFYNLPIIAFVVFLLVKFVNKLMPSHDEAPADPEPSAEEKYLAEIVELLKDKQK